MSLPSEIDLPDPPLDNTGELLLPPELQALVDRLRRESVNLAEAEVPQAAAATLLQHAAKRGNRQTWRQVALVAALLTVCASIAVVAVIFHQAAELARPLPGRDRPMLSRYAAASDNGPLATQVDSSVFLSTSGTEANEQLEFDLAAAADSLTDEQHIAMLEKALEGYRNALTVQNERLLELEAELKEAKEELAKRRGE